ncbi:TRAP-type mannitol/chloroaromatic compound transport system permease small subunit [Albidovulum inexpectatum]|uniref:TRAP transporter small permease protein n=1 Tax=Albidovulum inexpectatum TaxID=196587 RepID=A0A2S5JGC1_9RHOB|nr:TRAP transporter small permease subunit [Albidovulum inexpectatum]PPB80556.1 TRAP-type mannitol/chloroaromatic compound transport system permease small subunit [Albidovulum inexpectatum]
MPNWIRTYVRLIDAINYRVGRFAMYLLFVLMGVMLYASISRAAFTPPIWTDEMGQFLLLGYFMLGGAYSLQLDSAVRMDLFYSRWSDRTRAIVDAVTILALIFYLVVLLYGGIESTAYAIEYGEKRRGLWQPYMWPIKLVMCIGITLMILQSISIFFKDLARARGKELS